jgi:hypothetical protein
MKKLSSVIISIVCAFFISGCATIIHDSRQNIAVHTTPTGANVMLDGQQQTSPTVFNVRGSSGYNILVNKDGYKPGYAHVDGKFRFGSVILGNILWLLPGLIVDLATGAAYEMQNEVTVPLYKNKD